MFLAKRRRDGLVDRSLGMRCSRSGNSLSFLRRSCSPSNDLWSVMSSQLRVCWARVRISMMISASRLPFHKGPWTNNHGSQAQ
ncbi:hypothetical protein OG21DRAFT_178998 [Imleria badia]|nr:hypothetical protein OG21DRAFT_178998 [Imleria badia]